MEHVDSMTPDARLAESLEGVAALLRQTAKACDRARANLVQSPGKPAHKEDETPYGHAREFVRHLRDELSVKPDVRQAKA
jgi:hypothetical protein